MKKTIICTCDAVKAFQAYKKSASWPPSIGTITSQANTGVGAWVAVSKFLEGGTNIRYEYGPVLERFDTSIIPAGCEIVAAKVQFSCYTKFSADAVKASIDWHNYDTIDMSHYSETPEETAYAKAPSSSIVDGLNTLTLINIGSISRSGYTGMRFHLTPDTPPPTGQSWFGFTLGTAKLIVTYITPPRKIYNVQDPSKIFGIEPKKVLGI
jgi:hypothetical protein